MIEMNDSAKDANMDPTPAALLDSAERLFADKGWDAVSLREVTKAAGANVASIHYHFGGKEILLEQVLLRRKHALVQRRAELINAATKRHDDPIAQWAEVLILPLVELITTHGEQGKAYVRLIWRCYAERPQWIDSLNQTHLDQETSLRFAELLSNALPDQSPAEVRMKGQMAAWLVFSTLAATLDLHELEARIPVLRRFVCAGLRAA